jgi:hypothetical protein
MSQTMNYSITVTFIRANNAGDDIAKFTPDENGDIHMTMRFGNSNNGNPIIKTAIMEVDEVYDWFRKTFSLMDADYDPFEMYQIDFPLMPSVLIHHRELHHHYETVMDAMEFHLTNWVKNDVVYLDSDSESDDEEPEQTNRHQFFNANGQSFTVRRNLTTGKYESWTDDESDSSESSLEEERYAKRRNRFTNRCHHSG